MVVAIGITGPRKLNRDQRSDCQFSLWELWQYGGQSCAWLVGCASGVDELARSTCDAGQLRLYEVQGREPWQFQARSKRMVDDLAALGGVLHAFPNKLCPGGITISSWKGSGTWGTVFYARSKGVEVQLHPLVDDLLLPDWHSQSQSQLSLF